MSMADDQDATSIHRAEPGEGDATRVDAAVHGAEAGSTRIVPGAGESGDTRLVEASGAAPEAVSTPVADPANQVQAYSGPTSSQMAESSRRRRRRERDSRAEKTAQRLILFGFLGLGGVALFVVNSGWLDDATQVAPPPKVAKGTKAKTPKVRKPPSAPKLSAAGVERPSIPALEGLQREGLTVVAEGLPEVLAIDPPNPPEILAGIESCRYAYAIWEFSPNKRFKFLTTCAALEGETLAGAWQLDGSKLRMSTLASGHSQLVSTFEVAQPSMMTTDVVITAKGARPVRLKVRQRVTGMRQGMDGDGWRRAYEARNNIVVRGLDKPKAPRAPPPKAPPPRSKDPLLDLLDGD